MICNRHTFVVSIVLAFLAKDRLRADETVFYRHQENIVYAEAHGVGLIMDIFTPIEKSNGLGIVEVVSGGWSSDRGKIEDLTRARVFEIFCNRGYTVFAVRPGSISKFSASEMVAHVENGIRWVKEHAGEYKIDVRRLGILGASAGGHLACLVAVKNGRSTADDDASVAAAGVFFPLTDFLDFGGLKLGPRGDGHMAQVVRQLAFSEGFETLTDEQIEQHMVAISPARSVTHNAPPFMIVHGDADPVVPLQQSQVFLKALKEHDVPAELLVVKGGGHPWPTIHEEVSILADWFDDKL